jgi:hypothetical protein
VLSIPVVATEIGAGFVVWPLGAGLALEKPFIDRRRRGHVLLSTAESPLVMEALDHGYAEASNSFAGGGLVAHPIEVD